MKLELGEIAPQGPRLAVRLTPDALRQVRGGHPWVYDSSIVSAPDDGNPGDLAVIFDSKRKFAAIGLWDPASPIRIQVLHHGKPTTIDQAFFGERVEEAVNVRSVLIEAPETTGYRVVHGENDRLGSLVADRYGTTLVLKLYSSAWLRHLEVVVSALVHALGRRAGTDGGIDRVVLRLSRRVAEYVGGSVPTITDGMTILGSPPEGRVEFEEDGLRFEADVIAGQKTGHFLDQRDNRMRVGDLAGGARVLDMFCHNGGFSVHAAAGGARSVLSVDANRKAIAGVQRHFELNSAATRACENSTRVGDAFEAMAELRARSRRFDIVVIDPPSFGSRQSDVAGAIRAYRKLTQLGLSVLEPGGLLVQASCSSRVGRDAFVETVLGAARSDSVELTDVEVTGHGLDHPIGFAQGAYLKAVFGRRAR